MNTEVATTELNRLRNRHVAKLLTFVGDIPPYLEAAIKKQFSMFTEDVETNIINSDTQGNIHEQENQHRLAKSGLH